MFTAGIFSRRAAIARSLDPCASARSNPRPCAEPAHRPGARQQLTELAQARRAAVAAERRVLHAVQLEQVERLRVVARGHLDLVAGRAQAGDDRPEHEHVRRRRHVDPDLHSERRRREARDFRWAQPSIFIASRRREGLARAEAVSGDFGSWRARGARNGTSFAVAWLRWRLDRPRSIRRGPSGRIPLTHLRVRTGG